jgi:hypothetical protein
MAITAEPLLDEEEVPLAVLSADTVAAVEQLRADARAAAEASRAPFPVSVIPAGQRRYLCANGKRKERACGRARSRKGKHEIVYRTLFGKLKLVSPRLYDCPCQGSGRHSTSPLTELLAARTAPELSYLETKFASLMSFGLSRRRCLGRLW